MLSDEGKRWEQTVADLESDQTYFKGNVFLAAAALSYAGPFTGPYRDELLRGWQSECQQRALAMVVEVLGSASDVVWMRAS